MSSLTSHSDAGGDRLVLQARALLIDSQMIDLIRSKSGEFQIVTKIRLSPGRCRSLTILTMPKSGGGYPVYPIFGEPTP